MNSKMKLNLALLGIVAVLGLLVALEPGKNEPVPLAHIDAQAVTKIQIAGKQNFTLEKRGGHWHLTQPLNVPANDNRVELLLKIPATTSEMQYPVDAAQLAKFQLNPPNASLKLGDTLLEFGGSEPIQQQRYVKVGNTLHLVTDNFYHHLTAAPTDYVEKKLLPENAEVQSIQLSGPSLRFALPKGEGDKVAAILTLSKAKDGKWNAEPAQASATPLSDMAEAWSKARAYDVQTYTLPKDGKVPAETAKITLANGQTVAFLVLQRQPDAILARPDWGLQFHLVESLSQQLLTLEKSEIPATKP